jgi:hypothetical protein
MAIQKSIVGRNAELNALAPLANNGYIRIYSGAIPATPETAASGTLTVTGTGAGSQRPATSTASGTAGSSDITGTSFNVQTPATSTASGIIQVVTPEGGGMLPRRRTKRAKAVPVRFPKARRETITGIGECFIRPSTSACLGQVTIAGTSSNIVSNATSNAAGWVESEEDLILLLALSE